MGLPLVREVAQLKVVFAADDLKVFCRHRWFCNPTFLLAGRLPRPPHGDRAPGGARGSGGQALVGLASVQIS